MSSSIPRPPRNLLAPTDSFLRRHIGPSEKETEQMLHALGVKTLDSLMDQTIPAAIRIQRPLQLPAPKGENESLQQLRKFAEWNQVFRSYIGMGYSNCITPSVIQRNILENPGWYTAYTPYQAEISQGRMEALINFQTMISDLTGMEIANASLLDEGTAAAEAMAMAYALRKETSVKTLFISEACHPQTIDVVRRRSEPLQLEIIVGDHRTFDFSTKIFAVLLQYPGTNGAIYDYHSFIEQAHQNGALAIVAADLLCLTLLKPPGEFGADIVVGNSQRFGVPLGYGGPHAAFFATRDAYKRSMPGRLIGVSKDARGKSGYRLSLQTREQHIRRDKATSNICTAQVLLAVIASMYAVYHGPDGLKQIALRTHLLTALLANELRGLGFELGADPFFDTILVKVGARQSAIIKAAREQKINFRVIDAETLSISLDETVVTQDLDDLIEIFSGEPRTTSLDEVITEANLSNPTPFTRTTPFLTHAVFQSYHTETELLRYIRRLEAKDLSLTTSMIPLGSCTMKLNATSEMLPVTWPEFGALHPFAPVEQTTGYQMMFQQLEAWLAEITGFAAVSLQPNAGSQGEYAGLLAIRDYHRSRENSGRNICIIPTSAHGTNPASAVMAGFQVVPVACDANGNIDVADLRQKAEAHADRLGAAMITYPSTHGVFEESIKELCTIIHQHGGLVYMDGANMNAMVGLCRPGDIGADVCHLNLHKTFCIPHGGGGPGMGPIGVVSALLPFLPSHPVITTGGASKSGAVSAAPWGSASILPISWMYIVMLGGDGLASATRYAILNANYIAHRISKYFPVLFQGKNGRVAHECIVDFREWKEKAGVEVEDVAKRLMDYGFHSPTMSWPVPGTLMIEPTESESKEELDRLCDALISIHGEITTIAEGKLDRTNNPLKNAPHTAEVICSDSWDRPYSRDQAAFPAPWTRIHKYWPTVSRIDNVYGDRNLFCSCVPVEGMS